MGKAGVLLFEIHLGVCCLKAKERSGNSSFVPVEPKHELCSNVMALQRELPNMRIL